MVATKPVDFRKGAEGLATLVRESMTADPFSRAVYVFRAKRADRIKLIPGTAPDFACLRSGGWKTAASAGRSRKAERLITHLDGFKRILQVDGYAGYRKLAERRRRPACVLLVAYAAQLL
jgi:transposase